MVSVIIVAAGSGKRMGIEKNKVFLDLKGKPVLYYSIETFSKIKEVDEIILVLKDEEIEYYKENFRCYSFSKVKKIVSGGKERMNSVKNGLEAVSEKSTHVLIHDGARPLISEKVIKRVLNATVSSGGAAPYVTPKDTIKIKDEHDFISTSLKRDRLACIQTPQGFDFKSILEIYRKLDNSNTIATDDTELYTASGKKVKLVEGEYRNIKITTEEDMIFAEFMITKN